MKWELTTCPAAKTVSSLNLSPGETYTGVPFGLELEAQVVAEDKVGLAVKPAAIDSRGAPPFIGKRRSTTVGRPQVVKLGVGLVANDLPVVVVRWRKEEFTYSRLPMLVYAVECWASKAKVPLLKLTGLIPVDQGSALGQWLGPNLLLGGRWLRATVVLPQFALGQVARPDGRAWDLAPGEARAGDFLSLELSAEEKGDGSVYLEAKGAVAPELLAGPRPDIEALVAKERQRQGLADGARAAKQGRFEAILEASATGEHEDMAMLIHESYPRVPADMRAVFTTWAMHTPHFAMSLLTEVHRGIVSQAAKERRRVRRAMGR